MTVVEGAASDTLTGGFTWTEVASSNPDRVDDAILSGPVGGASGSESGDNLATDQWQEEGCAPNLRHKKAMERALDSAHALCNGIEAGMTSDLLTIDILDCLDHLSAIVGETTTEDVLDRVFGEFCIGK